MNEHLASDTTSHIYKHLSDSSHWRSLSSPNSFKILYQASTEYKLRIKEAIQIQLEKPSLNKRVKHANITLFLYFFSQYCINSITIVIILLAKYLVSDWMVANA